jgi:BMFP domain-containing protein YqiC
LHKLLDKEIEKLVKHFRQQLQAIAGDAKSAFEELANAIFSKNNIFKSREFERLREVCFFFFRNDAF